MYQSVFIFYLFIKLFVKESASFPTSYLNSLEIAIERDVRKKDKSLILHVLWARIAQGLKCCHIKQCSLYGHMCSMSCTELT